MRILLFVCLFTATTFGQSLTSVGTGYHNKVLQEAKITENGLQRSPSPSVQDKFCPPPENTTGTGFGSKYCYLSELNYNVNGEYAIVKARSRTYMSNGRVYHSWTENARSNTSIQGWGAVSDAHAACWATENYRVQGGPSATYRVHTRITAKVRNPVGISALESGDLFGHRQVLQADAYNSVTVTWDKNVKKWKFQGSYRDSGGTLRIINETVEDSGTYTTRQYNMYPTVSRDVTFSHTVSLNWSTGQTWNTQYGVKLEHDGPFDPVKNIVFDGYGDITVVSILQ